MFATMSVAVSIFKEEVLSVALVLGVVLLEIWSISNCSPLMKNTQPELFFELMTGFAGS